MEGDEIGDEDITTPRRDHITVEQRGQSTPHDGAVLDGLDPQVEGEDEEENGNCFVIVAPSDRA